MSNKIDFLKIIKQILVYIVGLLFLAFGVSFSIKSNLGVSPVNSIPYILSLITEINMGHLVTTFFVLMVLLQWVIWGKRFKLVNLFQIVFSTISGYFISFSNFAMASVPMMTNIFMQLLFLAISIVLVAFGLLFYLNANLLPMPVEGVILAVSTLRHKEFAKIKVLVDCLLVGIASALSLIFMGKLNGIGLGTVISAIMIGKTLGILTKYLKKYILKIVG